MNLSLTSAYVCVYFLDILCTCCYKSRLATLVSRLEPSRPFYILALKFLFLSFHFRSTPFLSLLYVDFSWQLVKNTFLKNERTISRKIVEMVLALASERTISKWRILSLYMSKVELSLLCHTVLFSIIFHLCVCFNL